MKPEYTTPGTEKVIDVIDIPEPPKTEAPAAPAAGGAAEGGVQCNKDECVFCGLCARNCPVSAITVDRGEKSWTIDRSACVQCGLCAEKCPKKCLSL